MSKIRLAVHERHALGVFNEGIRGLLTLTPESVGRIADYVGEYGVEEETVLQDGVLVECLRIMVDAKANRRNEMSTIKLVSLEDYKRALDVTLNYLEEVASSDPDMSSHTQTMADVDQWIDACRTALKEPA